VPSCSGESMSDVYCVLKIGPTAGRKEVTETKDKTINAIWERTFMLKDVLLTPEEFKREKVTIQVFDKNVLAQDALIGTV